MQALTKTGTYKNLAVFAVLLFAGMLVGGWVSDMLESWFGLTGIVGMVIGYIVTIIPAFYLLRKFQSNWAIVRRTAKKSQKK